MTTFSLCRGWAAWLCGSLLITLVAPAQADVAPAELLLAELNCVACHDAPGALKTRLTARVSPRLGQNGTAQTPQWLRAFLADPSATQPGTLMPDALHALPAGEKTEAAEALTHYLVSLQTPDKSLLAGYSLSAVNAGRSLYHTLGCVACHAPQDAPEHATTKPDLVALAKDSAPLGDLARKFALGDLAAFLKDPLKAHPSGRMPSLKLTDGEARAIATYLLRAQAPSGPSSKISGVHFDYYEVALKQLPDFAKLTPKSSGAADNFTLTVAPPKGGFALRFQGVLTVPKDGEHTFYAESDDGSRVWLDEKVVVDNDGVHPPQERSGKVTLKAGEHGIVVAFFDDAGGRELKISWKGPGFDKREIPASVLAHDGQPMRPLGDAPFAVDATKSARGKELFAELNCAACHQLDQPGKKSTPLNLLTRATPAGCLAAAPSAKAPKFPLTAAQRTELHALLTKPAALEQALTPAEEVKKTMVQLNCVACHTRDGQGGPTGARRDYFTTNGEVDLGDEGSLPPHLSAVGAKLQPAWMMAVLGSGDAVRPYMATRMPQFGTANVGHLPAAFSRADERADALPQPDGFAPGAADAANKHGRRLVGTTGLSCIACHTFAGSKSLGVPALDLALSGQRLKWDWFRRYLLDPNLLRPGTRMPPFWPEGKAANKDILGGDTEKQIAAIWFYLARKNFTDLPTGLVQAKMEIIALNEAAIYRNFIKDAGPRAIGVGYPEKANLAFDANDVCLALVWQGGFIDAARHRTGRGEGYEPPLGHAVVKLPAGAPFAVLASEADAWPKEAGKSAGYQFKGYTLDEKQRPTFRYTFGDVAVEDFPLAVPGDGDATFRRTLTLRATKPVANLFFRAAIGTKIEAQADGAFLVDDKVRLKFTGAKAEVRKRGDKTELLVPVTFNGKEARLVEEILW